MPFLKNFLENQTQKFIYGTGDYYFYEQNKKIFDIDLSFVESNYIISEQIVHSSNTFVIIFGPICEENRQKLFKTKYQIIELHQIIDYMASKFWNNKKTYKGIDENHYCSNEVFLQRLIKEQKGSFDIEQYFPNKNDLCILSLGCGTGQLERDLLNRNICTQIDAIDISEESIKEAIEKVKEIDKDKIINYYCSNLNTDKLQLNKYDLIIAQECMHHIQNLEFAYTNINNALKENGVFVQNEYVGPNRFQWNDYQIKKVNDVLKLLPLKYKAKEKYEKQKIEHIIKADPSEAVRSVEILPLSKHHFDVISINYYSGTLMHILYQCLNPKYFHTENFKPFKNKLRSQILARWILAVEKKLKRNGFSDFANIIARKAVER